MKLTKILTGGVVLVMCCATAPQFSVVEPLTATASCGVVTGSCGDNATYTFDENEGADIMVIQGTGEIRYTDEWDLYKKGIKEIIIEDGITSIGWGAFQEFTNLTSISIPDSVTNMESAVFSGCTSLESITIPNGVTCIFRDVFFGCTSLKEVNLPNGLNEIGVEAFANCTSLESIELPDGITELSRNFTGCTSLKNVKLPNSLVWVGLDTFSGCTSLENIELPDTVTNIIYESFLNCPNLKSITIPESVVFIGEHALGYTMDDLVYQKVDGFTIYGYKNSVAEDYANSNGFTFVPIDEMFDKLGVVMVKKQILGVTDYHNTYINLDYNSDDTINILDLIELKKLLFS